VTGASAVQRGALAGLDAGRLPGHDELWRQVAPSPQSAQKASRQADRKHNPNIHVFIIAENLVLTNRVQGSASERARSSRERRKRLQDNEGHPMLTKRDEHIVTSQKREKYQKAQEAKAQAIRLARLICVSTSITPKGFSQLCGSIMRDSRLDDFLSIYGEPSVLSRRPRPESDNKRGAFL
jgi:hypothetical protein